MTSILEKQDTGCSRGPVPCVLGSIEQRYPERPMQNVTELFTKFWRWPNSCTEALHLCLVQHCLAVFSQLVALLWSWSIPLTDMRTVGYAWIIAAVTTAPLLVTIHSLCCPQAHKTFR
jgi:hypothetical protein